MHPVYCCTEDYLWEVVEILKRSRPLVHIDVLQLWRLLCDPWRWRRLGPALLTFFLSQLINKLTDLPYPVSCFIPSKVGCSPNKNTIKRRRRRRRSSTDIVYFRVLELYRQWLCPVSSWGTYPLPAHVTVFNCSCSKV